MPALGGVFKGPMPKIGYPSGVIDEVVIPNALALVNILAFVAESCPELAAWCVCDGGRDERCAACALGGPDRCESTVIKALARRLAEATTKKL